MSVGNFTNLDFSFNINDIKYSFNSNNYNVPTYKFIFLRAYCIIILHKYSLNVRNIFMIDI